MSLLMAAALSLYMSLVNNLMSGDFVLSMFLITLATSFVVSLIIGMIVPMPKISKAVAQKMKPGPAVRVVDTLVSDLIYTPIITVCMIAAVRKIAPMMAFYGAEQGALAHGAPADKAALAATAAASEVINSFPPFLPMFLKSCLFCLVLGFLVIYVAHPVFMKIAFKGIDLPGGPGKKPEKK